MKSPDSKNTINWQRSIQRRKELIEKAKSLNIIIDNPHSMKIDEIDRFIETAERWTIK